MEPGVAEVKRMYVEPEARRKGVAEEILRTLEGFALESGYLTLRLETGIRQPGATRFYQGAGYERIPCYGQYSGDPLSC